MLLKVVTLAEDGRHEAEITGPSVDPSDADTIVESVRKTHRAVRAVALVCASEVAAIIQVVMAAFDEISSRTGGAEVPQQLETQHSQRDQP